MSEISSNPIGVFDSGIGGLTVLNKLREILPNENYIYLGDNENAPYGNKSLKELKRLVFSSLDYLVRLNVKALVIACNTVSTNLKNEISNRYSVPIIFTLPKLSDNSAVLTCTPSTAKSDYVSRNFKGLVVPFPMLAAEIENSVFDLQKVNYKADLNALPSGTNKIVLGCTHYVYLKELIKNETGAEIIDGLDAVAENLKLTLKSKMLLNDNRLGSVEFIGKSKGYNRRVYQSVLLKNGL